MKVNRILFMRISDFVMLLLLFVNYTFLMKILVFHFILELCSPFYPNLSFLHPLKTKVFLAFSGGIEINRLKLVNKFDKLVESQG